MALHLNLFPNFVIQVHFFLEQEFISITDCKNCVVFVGVTFKFLWKRKAKTNSAMLEPFAL